MKYNEIVDLMFVTINNKKLVKIHEYEISLKLAGEERRRLLT